MMMVIMVRERGKEKEKRGVRVSGLGRVWNDVLCWFGMDGQTGDFLVWMLLCFGDALSFVGLSFPLTVRSDAYSCVLLGSRRKWCGDWFEQENGLIRRQGMFTHMCF